ncbi:hypothetical protein EGR_06116 [Echinococcus granulosus]|uniref:Uncharacterized protein n=1 Tax=Echinococcus granulosus TaxID=6210 RepID=W6UCK8_ECHGR|nr:hypothetical protein EGR_06116 [Echinococcus granulosus]EUB59000.1 hypothetical protein EGR_06116 [Echinococcus granulosus]
MSLSPQSQFRVNSTALLDDREFKSSDIALNTFCAKHVAVNLKAMIRPQAAMDSIGRSPCFQQ